MHSTTNWLAASAIASTISAAVTGNVAPVSRRTSRTARGIDDDISLRMGLNRRAAGIVDHLFTSSPASLNAATVTSLIFVTAGLLAVASSLQQIYEKVSHQAHRGLRDLFSLLTWIVVLCLAVAFGSVAERLAVNPPG
jgi:hypothetical protein